MLSRLAGISDRTRHLTLAAMTVVILAVINIEIAGKEKIVQNGTVVLLQLAPVDPRSLMQGDYMALRYSLAGTVARAADDAQASDGSAVIRLADNGEAEFVRIYQGQDLGQDELLLRFRKRGESVRLSSDAFFFEEGQLETYRGARFGEIRVDDDGDAVLTGLRDMNGLAMGEQLH